MHSPAAVQHLNLPASRVRAPVLSQARLPRRSHLVHLQRSQPCTRALSPPASLARGRPPCPRCNPANAQAVSLAQTPLANPAPDLRDGPAASPQDRRLANPRSLPLVNRWGHQLRNHHNDPLDSPAPRQVGSLALSPLRSQLFGPPCSRQHRLLLSRARSQAANRQVRPRDSPVPVRLRNHRENRPHSLPRSHPLNQVRNRAISRRPDRLSVPRANHLGLRRLSRVFLPQLSQRLHHRDNQPSVLRHSQVAYLRGSLLCSRLPCLPGSQRRSRALAPRASRHLNHLRCHPISLRRGLLVSLAPNQARSLPRAPAPSLVPHRRGSHHAGPPRSRPEVQADSRHVSRQRNRAPSPQVARPYGQAHSRLGLLLPSRVTVHLRSQVRSRPSHRRVSRPLSLLSVLLCGPVHNPVDSRPVGLPRNLARGQPHSLPADHRHSPLAVRPLNRPVRQLPGPVLNRVRAQVCSPLRSQRRSLP